MSKKLLLTLGLLLAMLGSASAAVNVNLADEAALESVKGLGAAKARAIVAEREAHGSYRDADDLAERVKGLGAKNVAKLQDGGLTIEAPAAAAKPKAAAKAAAPKAGAAPHAAGGK